jgi:hypothetical protein
LSAGFLVSVESLLTTAGKEQGMLEDLSAAATWLSTISVRLLTRTSASASASAEGGEEEVVVGRCEDISVWRRRGEGALVVDLWLSERDAALVASTMAKYRIQVRDVEGGERMLRRSGSNVSQPSLALEGEEGEVVGVLSLTGVLVSQGINVLQSLSNLVWNPSSLHINDEALAVRMYIYHIYICTYRHMDIQTCIAEPEQPGVEPQQPAHQRRGARGTPTLILMTPSILYA